jgi:hypothetical protein
MLVRAAGTGSSPQTALINESTDTGRLRLIKSMASTARCFGAPAGNRTPWLVISNGPKTPNPVRLTASANHFDRMRCQQGAFGGTFGTELPRPCVRAVLIRFPYHRPSCPTTVKSDRHASPG